MPNRIIKESICTSESIDALTTFQEVFFYRLIVSCDDFGRYDARPKVLAARLFPLKDIRASQAEDALRALASAELVTLYEVDGKPFLQIVSWNRHQQPRAKTSKYPAPDSGIISPDISCTHMISSDGNCMHMISDAPDTRYTIHDNDTRYTICDNGNDGSCASGRVDVQSVVDMYHSVCVSLPKVRTVTDSRRRTVAARMKELDGDMDELRRILESVESSDFLTGRAKEFTASFDWIFRQSNFVKIREGNYDNRGERDGTDGHTGGEACTDWGFADDGGVV